MHHLLDGGVNYKTFLTSEDSPVSFIRGRRLLEVGVTGISGVSLKIILVGLVNILGLKGDY